MKYTYQGEDIPQEKRNEINEKILHLIDSGTARSSGITQEDIFNAYTGDGGLHGLNRKDFDNYNAYSEAKKEKEQGQFFTPPLLCQLIMESLKLSKSDVVADLTCGMGNFFNYIPAEENAYGCEIDSKAYKVARHLYPAAHIECKDVRNYQPDVRFDYVVGNPPFHLRWKDETGAEFLSQFYYCLKAARHLKPMGIMALVVPESFLADTFQDSNKIKQLEADFSFLGQVSLPGNAFASLGVTSFPTKIQYWQKRSSTSSMKVRKYTSNYDLCITTVRDIEAYAERIYQKLLAIPKSLLQENSAKVLLELARTHNSSREFQYTVQKMLYQIQVHPRTKESYARCCEYLHSFYTQVQPANMPWEEWSKKRITEAKVLAYLRRALAQQNKPPEQDLIRFVLRDGCFSYKGYSAKSRHQIKEQGKSGIPLYQAVLDNEPDSYPGYEKLLRRKRREYDVQNQPFSEMTEDPAISQWLNDLQIWDSLNDEHIVLNEIQRHDINLVLQKRYTLLQWEQGSGKTLAAIATSLYRMQKQHIHSTWVVSSAISIRNNWDDVLRIYDLPYVFVEKLSDLDRIKPGDFVIMTLNKVTDIKNQIARKMRRLNQKVQFILDESDEISNENSQRCRAVLSCFRRCWGKLLTTGTSTRNNISEFMPQLELLYNNSINMISWCSVIYKHCKEDKEGVLEQRGNEYYGQPIPAYKKGYSLFSASHLPEKITVFGVSQRTQDIYNADVLDEILAKTVITRTFKEVSGKDIRRIHQVPIEFAPEEKEVYQQAMEHFHQMRFNYFNSTGNSRKDAAMRLIQQIMLLLRISAAPDSLREYTGDTPIKILTAVEMAACWPDECVAIGVRHKVVLDSYVKAFKEILPDRTLFVVTGSTTSFAKRRALHDKLKNSKNGILLCTQQSLPSSVNFEFVNKIIIPELHYNNSGMSQFYMRFIRYTSTDFKDIYFLTYMGSIESNQMQMVLAKEKLNLFMKGQNTDLNTIYEKFDVNYDLLSMLMTREQDEKGHFHIRWGEQMIA